MHNAFYVDPQRLEGLKAMGVKNTGVKIIEWEGL
jgi:hypothetical protein